MQLGTSEEAMRHILTISLEGPAWLQINQASSQARTLIGLSPDRQASLSKSMIGGGDSVLVFAEVMLKIVPKAANRSRPTVSSRTRCNQPLSFVTTRTRSSSAALIC